VRDSLLQAVAPALSLEQLLNRGQALGRKLRERPRKRMAQMSRLVSMIQNT
jgi:hypothetical protein